MYSKQWGGQDSNLRPTDYESETVGHGTPRLVTVHHVSAGRRGFSVTVRHRSIPLVTNRVDPRWTHAGPSRQNDSMTIGPHVAAILLVLILGSCDRASDQPSIPQALESKYCDHVSMWQSAIQFEAVPVEEKAAELRIVEDYINDDARQMSQLGLASSASAIREVSKAMSVYRTTLRRGAEPYALVVALNDVFSALKRVPIRCPSGNT